MQPRDTDLRRTFFHLGILTLAGVLLCSVLLAARAMPQK